MYIWYATCASFFLVAPKYWRWHTSLYMYGILNLQLSSHEISDFQSDLTTDTDVMDDRH